MTPHAITAKKAEIFYLHAYESRLGVPSLAVENDYDDLMYDVQLLNTNEELGFCCTSADVSKDFLSFLDGLIFFMGKKGGVKNNVICMFEMDSRT